MMTFSVIIPQRNSIDTLPRLLESIPNDNDVEIIVVDNSDTPISRDSISGDRPFILLHAEPNRYAGGARNEGLKVAQGEWLVFADADDFFSKNAFDVFRETIKKNCDLAYFKMGGVYEDNFEPSDRGSRYTNLVDNYINGKISENEIRLKFSSPCSKIVKRELVTRYNIKFDEVVASNDVYFSLLTGYYSEHFLAIDACTYIATTHRGSLLQRRDLPVIESRFRVALKKNSFLKSKNLKEYQESVMYYLYEASKYGIKPFARFISLMLKAKQNPFIGYRNWTRTVSDMFKNRKINSKYTTR